MRPFKKKPIEGHDLPEWCITALYSGDFGLQKKTLHHGYVIMFSSAPSFYYMKTISEHKTVKEAKARLAHIKRGRVWP